MEANRVMEVDKETARSEEMGFFHGERKEALVRAADTAWSAIKAENLSITQAEKLLSVLNGKIKEEKMVLMANAEIK